MESMHEKMVKSCILTPKNVDTDFINEAATARFPGVAKVYHSEDYIIKADSEDAQLYDTEFLNSLNYSGLPPHTLFVGRQP
jgi:PIF1-like helicase